MTPKIARLRLSLLAACAILAAAPAGAQTYGPYNADLPRGGGGLAKPLAGSPLPAQGLVAAGLGLAGDRLDRAGVVAGVGDPAAGGRFHRAGRRRAGRLDRFGDLEGPGRAEARRLDPPGGGVGRDQGHALCRWFEGRGGVAGAGRSRPRPWSWDREVRAGRLAAHSAGKVAGFTAQRLGPDAGRAEGPGGGQARPGPDRLRTRQPDLAGAGAPDVRPRSRRRTPGRGPGARPRSPARGRSGLCRPGPGRRPRPGGRDRLDPEALVAGRGRRSATRRQRCLGPATTPRPGTPPPCPARC